jgi:hypothetical protein
MFSFFSFSLVEFSLITILKKGKTPWKPLLAKQFFLFDGKLVILLCNKNVKRPI